jgi:RimJ/RimL family protein N-acetyltransferase
MPSVRLPYEIVSPLRTARLVLRHMTDSDVDDIHSYQSREDVCRYLPYVPRTREEVAAKVAQFADARLLAGSWRSSAPRRRGGSSATSTSRSRAWRRPARRSAGRCIPTTSAADT